LKAGDICTSATASNILNIGGYVPTGYCVKLDGATDFKVVLPYSLPPA